MDVTKTKDYAESFLKLLTILVGILYIFGIIIQSIEYDALGIHENAFIQVRSIMTGVSFALYFMFFILLFLSVLLSLLIIISPIRDRSWYSFFKYGFLPSALLIFYLVGIYIGFLTPWGREWKESYWFSKHAWSLSFTKKDIVDSYHNVQLAFGDPKAKMCFFLLAVFFLFSFLQIKNKRDADIVFIVQQFLFPPNFYVRSFAVGLYIGIIFLLLPSYATEVFPNIKASMGGGQPNLIQLKTEDKIGNDRLGTGKDSLPSIYNTVLWKQDDNFTYVSLIDSTILKKTTVIAIKTSAIIDMTYLAGNVRIVSGNQVVSYALK